MYAGQVVEQAPAIDLFDRPEHPYTEALLGSLPHLEGKDVRNGRLVSIPGRPPDLLAPPEACRFAPRCKYAGIGRLQRRGSGAARDPHRPLGPLRAPDLGAHRRAAVGAR